MFTPFRGALVALACFVCSPQSSAQGAGVLTPTASGYTWTRGALRFELRNRHATWSTADVAKLQSGLDRLPDVLLQHAMQTKVVKLYRDDVPRKRLGLKTKASATTVIDAGAISFGDVLFTRSADTVYRTVVHEFGHVAQYAITRKPPFVAFLEVLARGTPGFSDVSWSSILFNGLRSHNGFVSDYARTNDREDFAESVEFYWINPVELLRVSPQKYLFIRDRVFNALSSPPSSRLPGALAIGPVKPVISQLGDSADDPLSLVKISGEYFMGIKDGGFNRVHYRGKRALHLPISRKTLYSWVPWLSRGAAPVTVTTQDGISAPQAFTVKKPWWKFW